MNNLSDYLAMFPGASREKSRFMALAEAVLSQAADLMDLTAQLQSGFSFAQAEGKQLDALAGSVGIWRKGMTDEVFRQYLLAKLCLWGWNGTKEGVPAALGAQPGVSENDNMDGTVTVSPAGMRQDLLPVPAGVRVRS